MPNSDLSNFGRFDPALRAFVLTAEPPRKWRNIHFNLPGDHELYAETSNLGDGPLTLRDHAGNTCNLVSWDAKYLYVRDDETNRVFTPWGDPVATPVSGKRCIFHAAYTRIESQCDGIGIEQTNFVPLDAPVELWRCLLKNRSDRTRRISLFAYALFQLTGKNSNGGGVWKDNESRVCPDLRGVWVHNRDRSAPSPWFNGYLLTNSDAYAGACGYRDYFTRESYSMSDPRILFGWNCDNRGLPGPDCAGIVQVTFQMPPNAEARADFILGWADTQTTASAIRNRYSPAAVDAALRIRIDHENRQSEVFSVDTGNPDRDALINHFVKKQMMSYLVNKSGFRDNLQNDLGVSLFDWPTARTNLLRAIASQKIDGSVPHSFRPWNHHTYSDKPAWLLHCVPWCLKESGELPFLDLRVAYSDDPREETIWEHMLRAMRHLVRDTGANGLCDQHFADWNDGLEPSEHTGARESVMVTQQLCLGLMEVAELARRRADAAVEREAQEWHAHFNKLLNTVAWDGSWYVRTLCSGGYTMGSDANAEGKIFINTQSWAVLSGTASGERAQSAMSAVDRMLETTYGFSIAAPAFTKFDERIGKFSASRPYMAENGGCYNHAGGFKGIADCMLGRGDEAWRTYLKVSPGSSWNPVSNSHGEPFSFTNCYNMIEEHPGRAQYPWRTGTAAWFTQLLIEWILGARRQYDGLLIDPCMPGELSSARLTRTFRGTVYNIEIDNTAGTGGRGCREVWLDDVRVEGNLLPPSTPGRTHRVRVII